MNSSLPELVQKTIAGFLQPINRSCIIRIQQNAGCMKGEHINKNCPHCSKRYSPGQIFFYLKKGGDKDLFEKWISKIKKNCMNDDSLILNKELLRLTNSNLTFKYFFNGHKSWLGKTELYSRENEHYESKYTLEGLHFGLFRSFVNNIDCLKEFYGSYEFDWERTIDSSSSYTEIFIEENTKNPLCLVNKIFLKYSLLNRRKMNIVIIFNIDKNVSFFFTKGENFKKRDLTIKSFGGFGKTSFSKYKLPDSRILVFIWKVFEDSEQFLEIASITKEKKLKVHAKWSFRNGETITQIMNITNIDIKYKIVSKEYGNWSNFINVVEYRDDEGKWEDDPRNGIGYICHKRRSMEVTILNKDNKLVTIGMNRLF